jgi:hypothetical protein
VPFLVAILVAAGLLALIGLQYKVWTGSKGVGQSAEKTAEQPEAAASQTATAMPGAPNPDDAKPSPLNPEGETAKAGAGDAPPAEAAKSDPAAPAKTPQPGEAERKAAAVSPGQVQPVQVITSPGGATAILDGQRATACSTPCSLAAAPGRHTISVSMAGYQVERREVEVGTGPLELAPMILRAPYGTLMLSSVPEGATVTVNGKRIPQVTNTQLQLPPGSYTIGVEKDGRLGTGTVDIHNDEIRTLRLILGE